MTPTLTLEEARDRFGPLTVAAEAFRVFSDHQGEWLPVYDRDPESATCGEVIGYELVEHG